jgi:hypothetical protein
VQKSTAHYSNSFLHINGLFNPDFLMLQAQRKFAPGDQILNCIKEMALYQTTTAHITIITRLPA